MLQSNAISYEILLLTFLVPALTFLDAIKTSNLSLKQSLPDICALFKKERNVIDAEMEYNN